MASLGELYGVAPPVDPAAVPPPVYQDAPPPPEAQAPPPQTNDLGAMYGVGGASPSPAPAQAPPPQNFVPGSSYRPPSAEPLPAAPPPQEAPPPDLEPWKVKDPTPAELEGMNPVERGLRERAPASLQGAIPDITGFQEADGVMGKAGHLIGGLNVFSDYGTDRTVKRAVDAATVGDPNATMGGISPGDIAQHPENILDIIPTFGANVPGGGEGELNDWLAVHPEVVEEYQRTGDSQAVFDAWLTDTGRTLESGGIPGAVAGMIRTGSQDVSIAPSIGVGAAAGAGTNAARLAGQEGLARGITVGNTAAQTVLDPAGMALETGVSKTLGGIFGLGAEADAVRRSDIAREVVGANLNERRVAGVGAMTPNPTLASAPTPPAAAATPPVAPTPAGPVAPTPQPVTQALPTGAVPMPQGTLLPPAQGAPNMTPNAANLPGQRVISPQGPNGRVRTPNAPTVPKTQPQTVSRNGSGSPFTNGRPLTPEMNGKGGVAPIMRDPARGWIKATGDAISEQDLQRAARHLESVDPDDMVEFPMGRSVVPNTSHRNAQYLAAMTERKFALDDWHAGRTGDKERQAAGKRWTDLFAKRITQFQEREVGRLLRTFNDELRWDTSPGATVPAHRRFASYWDNRARSIIEAANKAGYEESFTITTPKGTHTYVGKNPQAAKQLSDMVPPAWSGNVMEDGRAAHFDTAVLFRTPTEKRDVVERLDELMNDPNWETPEHKQFRQRLYKRGAWSQRKASPITVADSAETVEKKAAQNAAYDRYQAFRAMHEAKHGVVSPEPFTPPIMRSGRPAKKAPVYAAPKNGYAPAGNGSVSVPLTDIATDVARFQPRSQLSDEMVNRIANKFDWQKFDDLVLWRDPKNDQLYVLKGHHRLAAVKKKGDIPNVPARIFEGNEEQAIMFARTSNAERAETPIEKAQTVLREYDRAIKQLNVDPTTLDEAGEAAFLATLDLPNVSTFERRKYLNLARLPASIRDNLTVHGNAGKSVIDAHAKLGSRISTDARPRGGISTVTPQEAEGIYRTFQRKLRKSPDDPLPDLSAKDIDRVVDAIDAMTGMSRKEQVGLFAGMVTDDGRSGQIASALDEMVKRNKVLEGRVKQYGGTIKKLDDEIAELRGMNPNNPRITDKQRIRDDMAGQVEEARASLRQAQDQGINVGQDALFQAGKATPLISGPGPRTSLEYIDGADLDVAKSLQDGFRAHLDKMGLGHVRLTIADYLGFMDEAGQYQQAPAFGQFRGGDDEMDLAISYTMDEIVREARQSFGDDGLRILAETGELDNSVKRALYQTLNHEGLHAFRASGVIKDTEWKALVNEARKRGYHDWALDTYGPDPVTGQSVYQYRNQFDALTRGNDQFDEEAVAEMFGDFALGKAQLSPATRNVFQRMVDLVKGLIDVVVRSDGERVMNDLLSGKIGSRAPSVAPVNPWSDKTRYLQKGKRFSSTALGAMDTTPQSVDGSWLGRLLTEPQKAVLRSTMPWKGADKSLFEVSNEIADDADHLRFLAQRNQTHGLSGPMQQDFDRLTKQFDLSKRIPEYEQRFDWSEMPDDEVDRVTTALFMDEWQKAKLPNMTPKQKTAMFGAIMQLNTDINGLRRSVGMSNIIGAPRQIMVQTFGNAAMGLITGKGRLVTGMFNPGEHLKAFRSAQNANVLSPSAQMAKDFGFPANSMIDTGTKTMVRNATDIKSPFIKGVSNILAPKTVRNLVAMPDDVARSTIARTHLFPALRKEQAKLPQHSVELWKAFDGKYRGQMPPIAPQQIEQTVKRVLKEKTHRFQPSRATGQDIQKAILSDFGHLAPAGTPQAKRLADFADQLGRQYNSARNTAYQLTAKETARVAFTWDNTKLDDFVANFALYHYWASRAAGLYAKEFARSPWKLAALAGFAEELQQDAERNNYPEWLKGMTRLTNSPAGMVLLASPLDLFGAMGMFEEWQFQNRDPLKEDGRDDGWFGQLQGIVPLFFGPAVQYGAYLTGGMGGEARPPGSLIGIEGSFKKAADIINAANLEGTLPAGMLRDENDMPIRVDPNMIQNAVQGMSNRLFGTPMMDLDAGFKANHIFMLQSVLREEHPEWQTDSDGENQMTRLINEMKAKADMGDYTPEWLEAEQRVLDMQMTGPDYPGLPEPLKYILRLVSPIRTTALPEERTTTMYGFGNKERATVPNPENPNQNVAVTEPLGMRDTYDIQSDKKGSPYDTLDMALLSAANEDYLDFGKDSGIADAAQMSNSIGKGELATNFQIGDFTYTPAQLSLMSKGERWDLAEKYLNSKGFTQADKDQYYADKEAIREAHPDLQGYQAYRDYANGYAGGLPAFVDTAVRTSPSFARFMGNLPYAPGTEDYYKAALWADAYYAIEGRQSSIYDPTTLPDRGTIPGMSYGTTFAQNAALQEAADAAAASSSSGGDGNSFESFVADVDKKVTNLYHAKRLLDEHYPGTGLLPGRDYLDKPLYNAMKDIWEANGVDVPEKNGIELEYYEWLAANATAPDHSVKAFINQRESTGGSSADLNTPAAADIASQLGLSLVESTPPQLAQGGGIDTSGMQKVSPAMPVEMRTGPSLGNPVNVQALPPGLPLYVADIEGEWAEVVAPGGAVGWVPTAALLKAA